MASQFSKDGKYFAQISTEGKLKIWNTISNSFEQEYTPDYHLTSPCTCIHFVQNDVANKASSPKKKKRRDSGSTHCPEIVLGTSSGLLLIYSITKARLQFTIDSKTSQSISCLSTNDASTIFSGVDHSIFVWDIEKRTVKSKWVGGTEKISAVLAIPDSTKLLTASKNIKLWDVKSEDVLRIFTGHSSQVCFLQYVNPKQSHNDAYFISGSKGDRILSCWNLNENCDGKNAVANFQMEDIVCLVSICVASDGSTNMAATVRSGVVHIYQHTLNGKCNKPLKPKTTLLVVTDSQRQDDQVCPLSITGAIYRDERTLCIGYGTLIKLFENVEIVTSKKTQCLLRKDPQSEKLATDKDVMKIRRPAISNDVHYLTPQTSVSVKRRNDGQQEVPMEKRLENLTLNKLDGNSTVPKADNVAQLLVQGLHSKDKNILKTALCKRDEQIIKNTVKRLPIQLIASLVDELTSFIRGKTLLSQIGSLWLRNLILVHAGFLLSNPDLLDVLGPVLSSIESRLTLQTPLNRLRGRLDLLAAQVNCALAQENDENDAAQLVYNDKESNESDDDDVMDFDIHSDTENEWIEESDDAGVEENEQELENETKNDDEDGDSSDEMST